MARRGKSKRRRGFDHIFNIVNPGPSLRSVGRKSGLKKLLW